jgi:predicted glutamine amidotransferase
MCLITVIPSGVDKYSNFILDAINAGFATQADGTGMVYRFKDDNQIHVDKGYFNETNFLNVYRALNFTKDDEVIIHHRQNTQGSRDESQCHPFFVTDSDAILGKGNYTSSTLPAIAHNGIINGHEYFDLFNSDTYMWVKNTLSKDIMHFINNTDDYINANKEQLGWSKFALIHPTLTFDTISFNKDGAPTMRHYINNHIMLTEGFIEDQGCFFSNSCYKNRSFRDLGGSSFMTSYSRNYKRFEEEEEDDFQTTGLSKTLTEENLGLRFDMKNIKEPVKKEGSKNVIKDFTRSIIPFSIQEAQPVKNTDEDSEDASKILIKDPLFCITKDIVKELRVYDKHDLTTPGKVEMIDNDNLTNIRVGFYKNNSLIASIHNIGEDYRKNYYIYAVDFRNKYKDYNTLNSHIQKSKSQFKKLSKILTKAKHKNLTLLDVKIGDTVLKYINIKAIELFLEQYSLQKDMENELKRIKERSKEFSNNTPTLIM